MVRRVRVRLRARLIFIHLQCGIARCGGGAGREALRDDSYGALGDEAGVEGEGDGRVDEALVCAFEVEELGEQAGALGPGRGEEEEEGDEEVESGGVADARWGERQHAERERVCMG